MEVSDQVHASADSRNGIPLHFENVASGPGSTGKQKTNPFLQPGTESQRLVQLISCTNSHLAATKKLFVFNFNVSIFILFFISLLYVVISLPSLNDEYGRM
jgi:hypothetical protein